MMNVLKSAIVSAAGPLRACAWVALPAAVLLSVGCASSGGAPGLARSGASSVDHYKVAAVEQVARKRGVEVVWINYPRPPDTGDR